MSKFLLPKKKKTLILGLISIVIIVSLILLVIYIKHTDTNVLGSSDSKSVSVPDSVVNQLLNPGMYEKIFPTPIPRIISTDNSTNINTLNLQPSTDQAQKVEKFSDSKNGFTVTGKKTSDLENVSFSMVRGDGTISDLYKLKLEEQNTDKDGKLIPTYTSQLYLFPEGVSQVNFFYDSTLKKDFTVNAIDFDKTAKVNTMKTLSVSTNPNSEYETKFLAAAGLNIITRDQIGIPDGNTFEPGWTPPYYQVNRIVIHHTATSVDMTNPGNTVKAIWNYHANTLQWGDLGYNYLIDPMGNIYEGRAGTNGVRGNHAPPNEGSIGIALLGDYSNQLPTQASIDTLTKLVSYLSVVDNIPLTFKTSFDAKNPAGVYPHRAIVSTDCPGNAFMTILPGIVTNAENIKSTFQTAIDVNSKVTNLLSSKDYVQRTNSVDVLIETTGLTDAVKTKLLNPSSRLANAYQIDGMIVYNLKKEMMKQFITEVSLVAPDAKPQPNYLYKSTGWTENTDASPDRSIPDDYNTTLHWNLEKIKAPEAWSALYNGPAGQSQGIKAHGGTDNVIVAILDTGVAYENYFFDAGSSIDYYNITDPDLQTGNITLPYYTNNTLDGSDNVGIERNYGQSPELQSTTFLQGYDAAQDYVCTLRQADGIHPCNSKELEKKLHANDDFGHGTYIASIIAASTGINTGETKTDNIVGIASNVKILPIKVFFPNDMSFGLYQNNTTTLIIKMGIDKAIEGGANIINMSFGSQCNPNFPCTDPLLEEGINNAYDNHDMVLVAATGNDNTNSIYFPAILPKVIAVGASNGDNTRANYSNYGPELDLVAPVGNNNSAPYLMSSTYTCATSHTCDDIRELTSFSERGTGVNWLGTSFAAPQVVAAAALIKSNKSSLTNNEIKDRLIYYATDLGTPGRDDQTGYGNLNIYNSLTNEISPDIQSVSPHFGRIAGGTKITISGHNFQTGAQVYLGNMPITDFILFNPTTIEFFSPSSSSGTYDVKIVNPNQHDFILSNTYTYSSFDSTKWYSTGPNNWEISKTKAMLSGDFNKDGLSDIALVYDYGSNDMGIWVMLSNGTGFSTPQLWLRTGRNMWDINATKAFLSGDFNKDGYSDIALVYNYGGNDMGIWVISSIGSKFNTPASWVRTGKNMWNLNATKAFVGGDYNNDGYSDIAMVYDYGSNDMGLWVINSNGYSFNTPSGWVRTGKNMWDLNATKAYVGGDYNNDGYSDIAMVYDYGSNDMGIWVVSSTGTTFNTPAGWLRTGRNMWDLNATKAFLGGDFNNDGVSDLSMVYDYGNNDMGIWMMNSGGNTFSTPNRWLRTGANMWDLRATKNYSTGDYDDNGSSDISMMYDYGSNNMGVWVLK